MHRKSLTRDLSSTSTTNRVFDHIVLDIMTRFRALSAWFVLATWLDAWIFPTNRFNAWFMVAACLVAWLLPAHQFNARFIITAWHLLAHWFDVWPLLAHRLHTRYFPIFTCEAWETASEADAFLLGPLNKKEGDWQGRFTNNTQRNRNFQQQSLLKHLIQLCIHYI